MRLFLVRHGQTPSNVDGILETTIPGPGLTDLGHDQAAALVDEFVDRGVEAVYVSDMVRTADTAAPLLAALDQTATVLPGLREIEAGAFEGARDEDSLRTYRAVVSSWIRGDRTRSMPGGSDGTAFLDRFDDAVAQISAGGAAVAVAVSHGAAIRAWAEATASNAQDLVGAGRLLENTGVVELDGAPGAGWRIAAWEGRPIGGPSVADHDGSGPTGEPV